MDLLIKNGTIVTAKESYKADVAVNDGKIVAIGSNLDFDADRVVDAGGKLVLPGAIDVHTHLAMPFGGTVSADSYLAGTRAAACGGVTTVFDYPVQHSGETIMGLINSKKEVLEKEACVDYAFHCCITDLNGGEILDEMETAVKEGITSFKCFFVYKKEHMMVDDATFVRLLLRAKELGFLKRARQAHGITTSAVPNLLRQRPTREPCIGQVTLTLLFILFIWLTKKDLRNVLKQKRRDTNSTLKPVRSTLNLPVMSISVRTAETLYAHRL